MRAGVHIAKANECAFALKSRMTDARRPVRLHDESHTACWNVFDGGVKELFGVDAFGFGKLRLKMGELLFKPADHPKAAINHVLVIVVMRGGGGIGGHVFEYLDIIGGDGVDGGGGAKAKTRSIGGQSRCA